MDKTVIRLEGHTIRVISVNTIVVGSGASGFNAADKLWQYGQKDLAIVTEGINNGTSRNTGSDKQTYYKLSLSGDAPDSVSAMASVLFSGQCVDGDHALCEAALSAQCFLRLAELGVPFPQNRYGEYVGYKTDHDSSRRATSVGPYTSRLMTERLEASVKAKDILIFDGLQAIKILTRSGAVLGLICIDKLSDCVEKSLVLFNCQNIIFATGGPAGMYARSVYPTGHHGATGMAFEAGALGKNLTEWQFGLASVNPRWNVSGTYMQVLPRFISTDKDGGREREFLSDFFSSAGEMLSMVFLKGYQWPFDVGKVRGGSSIIDILVYIETELKGRRVFLDFRKNSGGGNIDFSMLSEESREYLEKAGACFGTPIERLLHMNAPAVAFYKDRGVDLEKEPLEIALCAQHNNGGLDIDLWWQTRIKGLFAVGEAAASHGVYRPGGSALNAGQAGSTRAALYIAEKRAFEPRDTEDFLSFAEPQLAEELERILKLTSSKPNFQNVILSVTERMSRSGGAIRNAESIERACSELKNEISTFDDSIRAGEKTKDLAEAYKLRDTLISQFVYLSAMLDYISSGGRSRGSALYTDKDGVLPLEGISDIFCFLPDDSSRADQVQLVSYSKEGCSINWRKVREIPKEDSFFENVWREYRKSKNVY